MDQIDSVPTSAPEPTADELLENLGNIIRDLEYHMIYIRRFASGTDHFEYAYRAGAVAASMQVNYDALCKIASDYALFMRGSGQK